MATIRPFKALRPTREKVAVISSPSFDSTHRDNSHLELKKNPFSILHIVRPYLHFMGQRKNAAKHFPLGLRYFDDFKRKGYFVKENEASFYFYRVIKGSNSYTGIIGAASVDDYLNNKILKHENTIQQKQKEVAEHINWFKLLGIPVLLTYPDSDKIESLVEHYIENHIPEYNFICEDQLKHNLWLVSEPKDIELIKNEFEKIPKLFIADGHHRTAGAAANCLQTRSKKKNYSGDEAFNFFPVCLVPFSKVHIFEYHRLIKNDLVVNSLDFLQRIEKYFEVIPSGSLPVQPLKPKEFGIYFNNSAYLLKLKTEFESSLNGILQNLDVSIVEEFLVKKIFQITDSRNDTNIAYIDGSKGIRTLQDAVDEKFFSIAITLFQTSVEDVISVAVNNLIMPPKSTWIEPKLRTGLIIYETE
ncbi:MAG: DUF1015 domain-containing protein [Bacteroidia bacterium]